MVKSESNENQVKRHAFVYKNDLLKPLVSGLISSTTTTIIYQPLELLKTRIQIRENESYGHRQYFGRLTDTAFKLSKDQGVKYLWRGTGAYTFNNLSLFSDQVQEPNNPTQAFCFGIVARSSVSFLLLPITVVKVRYECGEFQYTSLATAIRSAYLYDGWVGVLPTVLRDSLFSGFYYMSYTKLRASSYLGHYTEGTRSHLRNFIFGIISGVVASIATNPLDVIKTRVQVSREKQGLSSRKVIKDILSHPRGYLSFFDGIIPRGIRRTMIAATTWTIFGIISTKMNN